jgi:putative spermidine/putrescine transport system permease protein
MEQGVREQRLVLAVIGVTALAFLMMPIVIVVPMSFSSAQALTFPPPGLSWRWYDSLFGDPDWMEAVWTSLGIAAISASSALVLGGLAAYGLDRGLQRWRSLAEANFMAPLIVPGVITAVALYFVFAWTGLLGTYLGLVIAHTILAVPLIIIMIGASLRSLDVRIEQVAWSLGASWSQAIGRVVLPTLAPSIVAAWIFAFVTSFDEIIVTSFVAGAQTTVPKKMYEDLILEITPTITAVATLLIGTTVVALGLVHLLLKRGQLPSVQTGAAAGSTHSTQ